ncbi:hypothetical protein [Miltoncostaea marina]|uniref:hypothetical protein n=1 Tax=Miltoncostaea marina TaxID=2843215 RepID=UPI001C3E0B23|nr:hypothetical protein [Miltoncostaea marina]
MRQGRLHLPVVYETWSEWREEQPVQPVAAPPARAAAPGGQPCATCWGQGRIMTAAANGEGLVPGGCWTCGGAGTVPIA